MMSYKNVTNTFEVKFACEHTTERRCTRRWSDEIFIRRGARKLCDVCASVWDAKRQAMIAEAVPRAKTASELKLSGSKKQIEWADRIRERWLFNVQWDVSSHLMGTNVERATESVSTQKQAIAVQQACTNVLALRLAAIDEVLSHAVAAWWIDWRFQLNDRVNRATDAAIQSQFEPLLAGGSGL
jgi:hypothetical protein